MFLFYVLTILQTDVPTKALFQLHPNGSISLNCPFSHISKTSKCLVLTRDDLEGATGSVGWHSIFVLVTFHTKQVSNDGLRVPGVF